MTDLTAVLAAPKLPALPVPWVEVASDDPLIELRARDVTHRRECLAMGVVLDEAKAAGRPGGVAPQTDERVNGVARRRMAGKGSNAHLLTRSRPMMMRLRPPPSSGSEHLEKTADESGRG